MSFATNLNRIEELAAAINKALRGARSKLGKAGVRELRTLLSETFALVSEAREAKESVQLLRRLVAHERLLEAKALALGETEALGLVAPVLFFEMVNIEVRQAVWLPAMNRREVGQFVAFSEAFAALRESRIDAFLATLGLDEVSEAPRGRSPYEAELLPGSDDRELITRKKPKAD